MSDTPRTDAAYTQRPNEGAWDFKVRQEKTMESLERELTAAREESDKWEQIAHDKLSEVCRQIEKTRAVTEQRDEARKLAERYRYLSCESQEEADETLLPWESNQPTEP